MVENLIAGYLSTGKRLVIPELGAFLKKDTGETVFVEFLKKDDGVFAELISQSLGIPASDAAARALLFSSEVKSSLAGKGFFIIPRVGTMRRDASGSITLSPTVSDELSSSAPRPVKTEPATVAPVQPRPTPGTIPPSPSSGAETVKSPQPRAVQPSGTQEPIRTIKPLQKPDPVSESYAPAARRPQRARAHTPQGKKKTDLVMIIAIIAALVAIGSMVFGLFVNSDPIGNIQPTAPRQEQVTPVVDGADHDNPETAEQ